MPFKFNIGDSICFCLFYKDDSRKFVNGLVTKRTVTNTQGFRLILKDNNLTHLIKDPESSKVNHSTRLYNLRGLDNSQYINIEEDELCEQKILLIDFSNKKSEK